MADRVQSRQHSSALASESQLRELMDTYQQPLLRYAQRLTDGDIGHAEDVVQEAFLRAWTHLDRLTADRGSVLGWLRRVVHNLVMDGYRRKRARPTEVDIEIAAAEATADPTSVVLDSLVVDQVLRGLWPEHRAALVEAYLNDRTAAEISAELGVPVGTIKSRVHYALRAARKASAAHLLCAV
ncbi:sigma-70 family RNA polymerase sigma factor [Micromonospora polyrhachis]|uniref:RNA polymerase sigma-70 factor (ECF subfamily) n=1 Tax=Micromonospora polyrhachis TaxID=1282883 RepID=A0A7W7SKQ4_9ACTN|nr:sigma-70 family RNA polymerase sigma factor [Micromonospora polyrhachis]MBB4956436.1 RNA polymerase sigma-70 factor (ECF subfamily) [Micromonospora polyrhachis]